MRVIRGIPARADGGDGPAGAFGEGLDVRAFVVVGVDERALRGIEPAELHERHHQRLGCGAAFGLFGKGALNVSVVEQALREAEALAQNPANFAAMLKIADETFKISAPGGDKVAHFAVYAVLGISALIFVHELGHFLAARWRGLKIERFAIWFGKPIWKTTVNGIEYVLGSIPAGGYVSLPQMATMEAIARALGSEPGGD